MAVDLLNGLVSYYKLDETSGTTAIDSHGSNNGTNNGATINQEGKIGKAYDFDGTNDYIYSNIGNLPGGYTISMWIKTSTANRGVSGFAGGVPTGTQHEKEFYIDSGGKIVFRAYDNTDRIVNSNVVVTNNEWRHILVTAQNNDYAKIYVDGDYKNQIAVGTLYNGYSNGYFTIGIESHIKSYFNGKIDEVGVWNRALNTDEISELYNNGDGLTYPFTPPIPKYTLTINKKGQGMDGGIVTITPDQPDYEEDEEVIIQASANGITERFHKYEGDIEDNPLLPTQTIHMDDDKNIDVYFQKRIKISEGIVF